MVDTAGAPSVAVAIAKDGRIIWEKAIGPEHPDYARGLAVDHRDEVAAMRPKALETARKRPWSSYRAELASAIARAFELPRNAR